MTPERDCYFRLTRVYGNTRVSSRFDGDANLGDALNEFEAFLRGCGYEFSGSVQIVEDET